MAAMVLAGAVCAFLADRLRPAIKAPEVKPGAVKETV
jgi:hypothetical protein